MNSSHLRRAFPLGIGLIACLLAGRPLAGYELFIHRPEPDRALLSSRGTIIVRGEIFGQLLAPSTLPSFNDLTGPIDRWNYGFRNVIYFSPGTRFLAQMVAHDDGHERTKFDWHFSLRQDLIERVVLMIGHDSDHDSDHVSLRQGKPFYTNRNYIGLGFPMEFGSVYIEPFIWFFHHTNQRAYLDLSGDKLKQEMGIRAAAWVRDAATLNVQLAYRTPDLFTVGSSVLLDVILRVRLADWLELSCGGGVWQDREESPLGRKLKYHRYLWGIAIPF